jgi:gluconate 5-dehydrogenase
MSARDLFDLTGVTALVTGAGAGGLGFHSALALGELGARVWVSDAPSRDDDLQATIEALRDRGVEADAILADVRDPDAIDRMFDRIDDEGDPLTVLAHHSGVNQRGSSWETTVEDWRAVVDINLTGTWLTVRRAARSMERVGRGKIITLGSIYTNIVGRIPEPAYYASKGGVANLTRGMAMELAPHGITANCIAPGTFYPTPMTAPLANNAERLAEMTDRTMLGRLGNPVTDLRGVVGFLASAASDYMTGQVVFVDGGWTAW